MAKQDDLLKQTIDLQDTLMADHYGISKKFYTKNKDNHNKLVDDINNITLSLSKGSTSQMQNTLKTLKDFTIQTSTTRREYFDVLDNLNNSTDKGFKQISPSSEENSENELVAFGNTLFQPYRQLVSEYRGVVRLIPEIRRCIRMITRDIMSTNEISKRSISNVYNETELSAINNNNIVDTINNEINDIIEEMDLELKCKDYIEESLIEGAKPVFVIPYKDIVQMMKLNDKNKGVESILQEDNKYHKLIPDDFFSDIGSNSRESLEDEKGSNTSSREAEKVDMLINSLIPKKLLDDYYNESKTLLQKTMTTNKEDEIFNTPYTLKKDAVSPSNQKYTQIVEEGSIKPNMKKLFDGQLLEVIKKIDERIDVYDDDTSPIALAVDTSRAILKHHAYQENKDLGFISYGPRSRNYIDNTDGDPEKSLIDDQFGIFDDKKNKSNDKKEKLDSIFDILNDKSKEDFLNDCIVRECDSEDVVPIIVAGKHVGYYVIELSAYTGNMESINKTNTNFTDMFLNQGFNNDNALTSSYYGTAPFASGMTIPQGYGSGAVGEFPNLGASALGGMGGPNMFNNMNVGHMAEPQKRNDALKKIMYSLITKKLKNKDLEDDKNFKDIVMNIIRDGNILKNDIKFTYVPEKYMVYFSPKLDGNGIPVSVLKDILLTCYLYISSIMTSALIKITRSSIRDKITLNIGNAKNMGMSIRSIENSLSTKKINVESTFTSLNRVLKLSSTSETVIEPVYNGEKIYDISPMEQYNSVPVDDQYTDKLLNTIITGLNSPLSIMSGDSSSEDLASQHLSRNADYRLEIIQRQKTYGSQITKFLKLIIVSKNIHNKYKDKGFDIDKINLVLSPPEYLNMKNAIDMFALVDSYIDNILKVMYDENDDSMMTNNSKTTFKRKLYKKMIPNLDWEEIEKMKEESDNSEQDLIESKAKKAISEQIDAEVIDFNKDEEGNLDTSSSDDFGSDSGSDDDFGEF